MKRLTILNKQTILCITQIAIINKPEEFHKLRYSYSSLNVENK